MSSVNFDLMLVFKYFNSTASYTPSIYKLPNSIKHLEDNIHVLKLADDNIGNMTVMLINDENADTSTFGFTSPVGYFNEEQKHYPNGLTYLIATTILLDDFYKNPDLMNVRSQVEPETMFWTSQTIPKRLHTNVGNIWNKIIGFDVKDIDERLVKLIADT